MNKNKATTKESAEGRYRCENWDEDYFRVNVHSYGAGRKPARKVVTKGTRSVVSYTDPKAITDLLRKGYEVRLAFWGGEDAIRLYPIMSTDFKRMEVKADTMGSFRTDTLSDKKAVFAMMGQQVPKSKVEEFTVAKVCQPKGGGPEAGYVTPDTMVTCPKCGNRFRVGRKNN